MSQTVTQKQYTESKSESSAQCTQPWPSLCAQAACTAPRSRARRRAVARWAVSWPPLRAHARWRAVSQRCVAPLDHDTIFVSRPSSQPRALCAVSRGRPRPCRRLPGRMPGRALVVSWPLAVHPCAAQPCCVTIQYHCIVTQMGSSPSSFYF